MPICSTDMSKRTPGPSRTHAARTALRTRYPDLLLSLTAEARRYQRGCEETQILFLRLFPRALGSADPVSVLAPCAQECDSLIGLDARSAALLMPATGWLSAQDLARELLQAQEQKKLPAAVLICSLPDHAWEEMQPEELLERLEPLLADLKPSSEPQDVSLPVTVREIEDEARVSAEEKRFLFS